MTRYRLPEELGGGEYEALTNYKSKAGDDWRHRFAIPGIGLVDVPTAALTEVKPPLPPEPPPGYYLAQNEAQPFVAEHEEGYGWQIPGYAHGYTWSEIHKRWPGLTFTRLVPEPQAQVTLPWRDGPFEVKLRPDGGGHPISLVRSYLGDTKRYVLSPARARAMARALISAANAVEGAK